MRRLIAILAVITLAGGPLALGGSAFAKDHHDDRRAERGGPRWGEGRGEGRGRAEGPPGWRGEERGAYGGPAPDARGYYGPPQAYAPQYAPRYAPVPAPRARRGGYLPPEAVGGEMPDYGRYRLRQPPRGYAWVRTANGYAMVSMATGQVFDVVPF